MSSEGRNRAKDSEARKRRMKEDPIYRAKILEQRRKQCARSRKRDPVRHKVYDYRSQCKFNGKEWALSDDEARTLFKGECFYCGIEAPRDNCHGIDRTDNNRGYVHGNVVTSCFQCNETKSNYSAIEFDSWATRFATRWLAGKRDEFLKITQARGPQEN